MKYIVTKIFVGHNGGHVFNPAVDVELFDTYVGALRWLVGERRLSKRVGDRVVLDWNKGANEFGREWFLEMTEYHECSHTTLVLARINENGFH